MVLAYYYSMFGIALALSVAYAFFFHKHFDANLTVMAVLIPVSNLSFALIASSSNIDEALVGLRMSYIAGCFLNVAAMFLIFNLSGFRRDPWSRTIALLLSSIVFASSLTIGYSDIFYVGKPTLAFANGAAYITDKHYGFMHTVFYVLVAVYFAITIAATIYCFFKKRQVSRRILVLVVLSISFAFIGFFGGRLITKEIEFSPLAYTAAMVIYFIYAARLRLYDASDSVTDSLVEKGETGFISFDNKMRYLNSNETAKQMIPELGTLIVDHRNEFVDEQFLPWVKAFEKDETQNRWVIQRDGHTYLINVNRLIVSPIFRVNRGYQFLIVDDTKNQQYIELIRNYNAQLEEEVAKKTAGIVEMHERLILGMATMVEGRDNSTGGHIKRTSDCMRILVDEIQRDGSMKLDDKFCKDLIKAAPMHDLGKIAVDDAILRKPGRYTPEEFEQMKTHAAEGARILGEILKGTEDQDFARIAVNVAHYHHERWDGSGYPKGLKGEEIPLEARIMAIADVYDALVSKRVYKERMSFEEANKIIMDGIGKHFDKRLEKFYVLARPRLEEYYRKLDS